MWSLVVLCLCLAPHQVLFIAETTFVPFLALNPRRIQLAVFVSWLFDLEVLLRLLKHEFVLLQYVIELKLLS